MKLAVCSLLVAAVAVAVAVGADRDALFVQQPDSLYAPRPLASPLVPPLVSFDEHSLFVRGERVVILSGEFHPWRLPVPSLWLDIFQKIKALGFNCVSFYVNWALLEGTPGNFTATGVFDFDPFFRAAAEAGLYLIAVCRQDAVSVRLPVSQLDTADPSPSVRALTSMPRPVLGAFPAGCSGTRVACGPRTPTSSLPQTSKCARRAGLLATTGP